MTMARLPTGHRKGCIQPEIQRTFISMAQWNSAVHTTCWKFRYLSLYFSEIFLQSNENWQKSKTPAGSAIGIWLGGYMWKRGEFCFFIWRQCHHCGRPIPRLHGPINTPKRTCASRGVRSFPGRQPFFASLISGTVIAHRSLTSLITFITRSLTLNKFPLPKSIERLNSASILIPKLFRFRALHFALGTAVLWVSQILLQVCADLTFV